MSSVSSQGQQEKLDKALSYLLTIGSKALIIMDSFSDHELSTSSSSSSSSSSTLTEEYKLHIRRGLDDESLTKAAMMKDEIIRNMRRRLLESDGLQVVKRSRSGSSIRKIIIRLKIKKPSLDCLVWRSVFLAKKKFYLKELKSITLVDEEGSSSSSNRFIRLENSNRFIDIEFKEIEEEKGFISWIQQTYMLS
jgi:hypothetical protein